MSLILLALVACSNRMPTDQTEVVDTDDTGLVDTGDPGDTGETDEPICVPDHDGSISWEELVADPALDVQATWTSNQAGTVVSVDVEGTDQGDGSYVWDFTSPTDQDVTWSSSLVGLQGLWFADSFPTATYVVGLDTSGDLLGVYQVDEASERLLLLGVASVEEGEALLVYTEPVVAFEYPLVAGKSWSSVEVEATGHYEGEDYPQDYGIYGVVGLRHTYRFQVDRHGTAQVPLGDFDVLRVRLTQQMTAVNETYGTTLATDTQSAYFFMTECTGLVARIRSEEGVERPDFDKATEYLRLGF